MISYQTYCQIKADDEQGLSIPQIAHHLALSAATVKRWLDADAYHQRKCSARASKLDPFKATIIGWLEQHPLTATQVHQRLLPMGYQGSYGIVKTFVRQIRPKPRSAFLTLAFAPGQTAQVDWGCYGTVPVGSTQRRLSFFLMVLCYSRQMYLEFTVSQSMEHFLGCHERAFAAFGGCVKEVMVDNLKSAVLSRPVCGPPRFHPRYLDLAGHYGFVIKPCGVAKGNEKGRVENGVGYVKKNFLNGLEISDFTGLNDTAQNWLANVANVRVHGKTRQRPFDMWQSEQPLLTPLPTQPFDCGVTKTVRASNQFRVSYDANRYSVPAEYANRKIQLYAYTDRLCMYADNRLIARHQRCYDRHQDIENPDHPKPLLAQRHKARDQQILARFLTITPKADAYYRQLALRRLNAIVHVRKIVALADIYGHDALCRAIDDAFEYEAFSSEYIANLLQQRTRAPLQDSAPLQVPRAGDWLLLDIDPPDLSIYTDSDTDDD